MDKFLRHCELKYKKRKERGNPLWYPCAFQHSVKGTLGRKRRGYKLKRCKKLSEEISYAYGAPFCTQEIPPPFNSPFPFSRTPCRKLRLLGSPVCKYPFVFMFFMSVLCTSLFFLSLSLFSSFFFYIASCECLSELYWCFSLDTSKQFASRELRNETANRTCSGTERETRPRKTIPSNFVYLSIRSFPQIIPKVKRNN